MTILPKCPSCGLESAEIRCPRCNALKVVGCSGVCSACTSSCEVEPAPATPDAGQAGPDVELGR
jgi:hypothetical protein